MSSFQKLLTSKLSNHFLYPYHQDEWRYLISGGTVVPDKLDNPAPDWISERMWMDILTLPALPNYSSFAKEFPQLLDGFKAVFDSPEPHM